MGHEAADARMNANSPRFTLDGGPELERLLSELCEDASREIRRLAGSKVDGLLLAGGYGRGEGGVLVDGEKERFYNDVEFYLFLKGFLPLNRRLYGKAIHQAGEELTKKWGIEVEFKLSSLAWLRRSSTTMFTYDLVMAHQWFLGNDDLLLGCDHHREADQIPLSEASRLLMNRCSGLLFSKGRLRRDPFLDEDADFVGRNVAKAQLALGDVALVVAGQYHWSVRERAKRMAELELKAPPLCWDFAQNQYQSAVEFKLHPHRAPQELNTLEERWAITRDAAETMWLWLESLRLGIEFSSPREYALASIEKCPESPQLRNRLINAKTFGLNHLLRSSSRTYPRARLYESLPILLWEEGALKEESVLQRVQTLLLTSASSFQGLVQAYERIWNRFN